MKLKHALIPYCLFIVIIPALLAHLSVPLGMNRTVWELVIDLIMTLTAIAGLAATIIKRKKSFQGWLPLLLLLILVLIPQLILWKTRQKTVIELRPVWRFALLYITLFIIPMEIHFSRKELCILIGGFCIFGLFCCAYEIYQHPRVWEAMGYFGGNRVQSFFDQRNRFGAYTALWFIVCIFAIQLSHNKLWLIPGAIFAVFLVMTESRGALLLAGVFTLCCLISYRKRLGTQSLLMILLDLVIILGLLLIIPSTRNLIRAIIDVDRGVTGRDRIWEVSWNYYLEANPLFGHGLGTQIEKIMAERLRTNVSTHNVYLYILISGGISLMLFYGLSFALMLRHHTYRRHYLIPLLIATLAYGCFELACAPFDYWHLSNMFTICLFFLPSASGILRSHHHIPIH